MQGVIETTVNPDLQKDPDMPDRQEDGMELTMDDA
jgi:hypothetical protein